MTHQDKGKFAAKHKSDRTVSPQLADLIRKHSKEGTISCADAFAIAQETGVDPAAVGQGMDIMEISIVNCQLGLFGYSPGRKIVAPAENPSAALMEAIRRAKDGQGIACRDLWRVVADLGVSKLEGAAVCEAEKVKIRFCQLGAF